MKAYIPVTELSNKSSDISKFLKMVSDYEDKYRETAEALHSFATKLTWLTSQNKEFDIEAELNTYIDNVCESAESAEKCNEMVFLEKYLVKE